MVAALLLTRVGRSTLAAWPAVRGAARIEYPIAQDRAGQPCHRSRSRARGWRCMPAVATGRLASLPKDGERFPMRRVRPCPYRLRDRDEEATPSQRGEQDEDPGSAGSGAVDSRVDRHGRGRGRGGGSEGAARGRFGWIPRG